MCVLMYMKLESLKKKGMRGVENMFEEIMKKFKFDQNYKFIHSRNSMNSKHRKHEESYTRTQ